MKIINENTVPEFMTIEQEKEYWESRGILDNAKKAKINKATPGLKRASFLNIRLSGEELTQLRDLAARAGTGPSTFARILIKNTLDQSLKARGYNYFNPKGKMILARDSGMPEPDAAQTNSIALVELSKSKVDADIVKSLFETLQKTCQCTVFNPKDAGYVELQRLIKANPSV